MAVHDRYGNECGLVGDARRLSQVNHVVRIVLLVADATCRKECVDAHNTGQVDAWLVGEDVAAAGRLWGVQACWLVSLHFGRMRTDIHRDLASSARRWGGRFA